MSPLTTEVALFQQVYLEQCRSTHCFFVLPSIKDKTGEIMMLWGGKVSTEPPLCLADTRTQAHNCHTDLDFLCVLLERLFLLSVL